MIYLDITSEEFFKEYPELLEDCIADCKELGVPFENIRFFVTKDSWGIELDECSTISVMKNQSVFYSET